MTVDANAAEHRAAYDGQTYYFCWPAAAAKFTADPKRYLGKEQKRRPSRRSRCRKARSTPARCIRKSGRSDRAPARSAAWRWSRSVPAAKPTPSAELDRHDAALLDRRRAGACPLLVLEMGAHFPGLNLHRYVSPQVSVWLQFVLATPVVLWAGWPFFVRGWASVRDPRRSTCSADRAGRRRRLSLQPCSRPSRRGSFRQRLRAGAASSRVYYEAAAVITVLVLLGQVLELRAREQTGSAIRALLNLAPKTRAAHPRRRQRRGGAARRRSQIGDRLRVRPGDSVPVDGVVMEGKSAGRRIDGDRRIDAGREGAGRQGDRRHDQRHRRASSCAPRKIGRDTMLARIVHMVAEAQRSRAPIQRLADHRRPPGSCRRSLLVAVVAFAAWMIWGPPPRLRLRAGRRRLGR